MSDPSDTVVIAGSPRSGTTLLLDVMASSLRYRKIFEPLHPINIPEAADFYYLYVRPGEKHPGLEAYMRKVLTGGVSTPWTNEMGVIKDRKTLIKTYMKFYRWRWWARRYIMKTIRANLMLPWMEANFGSRIVFITRHPCAVVESQKRMGWEKGRIKELERVLSQEKLREDHLHPFEETIERIARTGDYWEKSALLWAIENMVPLKQAEQGLFNPLIMKYEDIVLHPDRELARIRDYTGINDMNEKVLTKPSRTADKSQFYRSREKMVNKWKSRLSDEQISSVMDVVHSMGMDIY